MKTKKIIFSAITCLIGFSSITMAQVRHAQSQKAIEANIGINRWSKFVNIGASKYLSDKVYAKIQLGYELGNYKDLLRYNRIFTDWSVYYSPFKIGNSFYFNLNGGVTAYYTKITDFETSKESYFNYGALFGAEGEYFLSDRVALLAHFKQKLFFRNIYGNQGYNLGLGIKFIL